MKTYCGALAALVLLAACASVQPAPPASEQSSAVGMFAEVRFSGLATYRADAIYFVRRCPAVGPCDERLIRSNYSREGRVYLLNAEPGEYLAVVAAIEIGNSLYFVYFPESLVRASAIEVKPGRFSYAGSYKVFASRGLCTANAEPGQLKYAQMIEPDSPKCGFWQPLVNKLFFPSAVIVFGGKAYSVGKDTYHHRGTGHEAIHQSDDTLEFVQQAQQDLARSRWRIGK